MTNRFVGSVKISAAEFDTAQKNSEDISHLRHLIPADMHPAPAPRE